MRINTDKLHQKFDKENAQRLNCKIEIENLSRKSKKHQ
jgi:hypothetical protein